MNPESNISHTVMRRVRAIHALRTLAPIVSGFAVFSLALYGIGREVWVAKVLENMPTLSDVPAVLGFYTRAFMSTETVVQVMVLAMLATATLLVRESMRSIVNTSRLA